MILNQNVLYCKSGATETSIHLKLNYKSELLSWVLREYLIYINP